MQASDIINQIGRANNYGILASRQQASDKHRKMDLWQVESEDLNEGEADLARLESGWQEEEKEEEEQQEEKGQEEQKEEEDGVLDAAPVAAGLLLPRATDGGKDQAGTRYHNFS